MTKQIAFGGFWTDQKLRVLSKYLSQYRRIFDRNERARFYEVTYLDAFAGTGKIPRAFQDPSPILIPELSIPDEEFRKGSVRRALEIEPPFNHYLFIEKDAGKYEELSKIAHEFPNRHVRVLNSDANEALIEWCDNLNCQGERAVVFLDPFGASVEWNVLQKLAATKAVDLWILFPCAAINRMLPAKRKPRTSWTHRLTEVFGTDEWENSFYTIEHYYSLLDSDLTRSRIHKNADHKSITNFFVDRMSRIFAAVSEPGYLYNSKGPLFALIFAAGNSKGADAGLRIANHLLKHLD
jgi:three-Cys-motif partner protein